VGFLLPALVLLVLARVERRRGVLRAMFHPLPLGAFLLMVLPWFIGVSLERPDFPYYGLVRESFERFTQPTFQRTGPFYYYVPVIVGVCFAWSLLLPDAIPLAWRRRARWKRADRLFVVWAVTVVLFFSLSSSKLPGYVLTSVVALGALVARLFAQALSDPRGSAAKVVFRSATTLSVVSLLIALWLTLELRAPSFRWGLRAFDIPDATVRPFVSPLLYTLATMSGIALVGRFTKKIALVLAAYFLLPISILTFIFSGFESYASYNSSAGLAGEINELPPRTTVVCFRCFPTGLGYYLRRTVFLVSNDAAEMTSNYIPFYLSREHASPEQIIPLSRLRPWLQSRRLPVLILASEEGASALRTLAATEGGVLRSFPNDFVGLFIGRRWRSQS
jgi:4-amino-4-deoxy-L-arabinose transferase-like glycosyltransferase